jgi:hypothetical protein
VTSALPAVIDGPAFDVSVAARALVDRGFAHSAHRWPSPEPAWRYALQVFNSAREIDPISVDLPGLGVVGEYLVPPPGALQRQFQALHFDFGLPLGTQRPVDIARFTALFVSGEQRSSGAVTRVVPLAPLLGQRSWPDHKVIADRLARSASTERSVEGILGRIIELADQDTSLTPIDTPGFLCGMEFASLEEEHSYFDRRGLRLSEVEQHVVLGRGELLLLDNLRTAHGRFGRRTANELVQLLVGYDSLSTEQQEALLDQILTAFDA